MLDVMIKKLSMSESEVLWNLSTNEELSSYAASVARDVSLTSNS
jgi:DNA polymerase III psi subunit